MTKLEVTLYRVADLVVRWSLCKSKVYQMLDAGDVFSVRIGSSRRVPASAVEAFEKSLMMTGQAC